MFDLKTYLPYLLNRVGVAAVARFSETLDAVNLTVPMWRVLAALLYSGPKRVTELGDLTSIELSTLSRLLSKMVRRGVIACTRARDDARAVNVALTPRGKRLTEDLIPAAIELEAQLVGKLSTRDVTELKRLLETLYKNVRVEILAQDHRLIKRAARSV